MEDVNNDSESECGILDDAALEEEVEYIFEELYENAVWDFCFDVHRAVKLNYVWLDPALDPDVDLEKEEEVEQPEDTEKDASGQKAKPKNETFNLPCPNCGKPSTAAALGKHLPLCLGIGGRTSSRDANKKITAGIDDIDEDNNSSSSSGKKIGNSSKPQLPVDTYEGFQSLSYEEKKEFLKEKCGVLNSKNKRCTNDLTCTEHTKEDRRIMRLAHLSRSRYPFFGLNEFITAD